MRLKGKYSLTSTDNACGDVGYGYVIEWLSKKFRNAIKGSATSRQWT